MEEIRIPDIGGATEVEVIEIAVAPGDDIEKEQTLLTLESDKASMEIPAPSAGKVQSVHVKVGDKVNEGDLIISLEAAAAEQAQVAPAPAQAETSATPAAAQAPEPAPATPQELTVHLPDLGTDGEVDVIAIEVAVGDHVDAEQTLLTLEGEKATMDIPAPQAGEVLALAVKVGDKVKTGVEVATLKVLHAPKAAAKAAPTSAPSAAKPAAPAASAAPIDHAPLTPSAVVFAGPAVRRFARELGVDLARVPGTGRKGRIQKVDVQLYVKRQLQQGGGSGPNLQLADLPKVDFAKFGPIESQPLNKIKRLTASNLHRNWVMVPHVTQFDEADITDLEGFRKQNKQQAEAKGFKLTPLVFIMKAVAAALEEYPQFNASLSPDGQALILKKYFHIGVAVDTPNGLVVPVIRDVDKKGALDIAEELAAISEKARTKGLAPADMQGSCFTISSLGGIGGTAFTPIVNMPDVAILGVSKAQYKPVYQDGEFVPRLILPLSLSYDHRVIDGAEAARFSAFLTRQLNDVRLLVL